jgi:predicted ATP-grasp superfamily ATP-dependent carboligase
MLSESTHLQVPAQTIARHDMDDRGSDLSAIDTPPVLLMDASYHGSLAAVRAFGRAGISVTVAGPSPRALAARSRFARRWVQAPSMENPEELVSWLCAFGEANPNYHLAITSDDVAWLVAHHLPELSPWYRIYSAGGDVLRRVLDKRKLADACAAVGIPSPASRFPSSDEPSTFAAEFQYPVLLKPRTQVLLHMHGKGLLVKSPDQLSTAFDAYSRGNRHHPYLLSRWPELGAPILQAYYPSAAENILSVAGFVDREGHMVALASRKVLQRPRRLGIGLCFESAPLRPEIRDALAALCRHVGYFGVFEAEFIEEDGEALLIDFNPRFYGQMQFEVDRGLNLPLLAYRAALGQGTKDLVGAAQVAVGSGMQSRAYMHRIFFSLMLVGQRITGRMNAREFRRWRAWRDSFGPAMSYAVLANDDVGPARTEWFAILRHIVLHPRSSFRELFLES